MTTSAVSAKGTVLIWDYFKLLEMVNITGLSESTDALDVTSHDSASAFREYAAGLHDGGELSLDGNFITSDSLGQIAYHTDMQAGTTKTCFLLLPMSIGLALSFSAVAKKFEPSFPADGKFGLALSMQCTGTPTLLTTQTTGISAMTGIEENGGGAITIAPTVAAGTYEYTTSVNTASDWVKLTVTATSHTIYIQGTSVASTVQSGEIALGAAGTTTNVWILAYESAKSPRLYKLAVTRSAA